MVDPEGMGEKSVLIMPHATASCSQELCTPRPRPPPAPSLLGAVVGSVPQTCRGAVSLQTSGEGGLTDRQLGTLAFHDRLDAVGLGTPAVALRRSTRASGPSFRFRPLPNHVARAVRASRAASAPSFHTGSASSPSTGVAGQRSSGGGVTGKRT